LTVPIWDRCLHQLEGELSEQQLNTWIRPLQARIDKSHLMIMAPNQFVLNKVETQYFTRIKEIATHAFGEKPLSVEIVVGCSMQTPGHNGLSRGQSTVIDQLADADDVLVKTHKANLNPLFNFGNFVEGKSNQLGRAAAVQIGQNPGKAYNPFFICGASGLGKTHLLHSVGNAIIHHNPTARVMYLNSQRYVEEMVTAIQRHTINEFKRFYRNLDALLIDDIQFFAGKGRTQEEFFHTFNALFDGGRQVILTCDRYPKEVEGLEDRLRSRFQWGLTVAVEPPDLETRVAILHSKAEQAGIELPSEVSFFIAKIIRSNVRELEGALSRVIADVELNKKPLTLELAREALRDLAAVQNKMVSVENIQKTVAEYYNIRLADLSAKTRSRSIARPRQVAMSLAKELTSKSLPEIGLAFGGRDHTTVLHACRKIAELKQEDPLIEEAYAKLLRTLST